MTANSKAKPHASGHSPHRLLEPFLRGLRLALVLTAVTQILHACHFKALGDFDHAFTTAVVSRLPLDKQVEDRPEAGRDLRAIQQIEISADLRVKALEARDGKVSAETVQRLQGVRPIDRSAMADVLQQLATCLATPGCVAADTRPKVLAIDVDLAPLPADEDSQGAIRTALDALRQHVHVVVIALDRSSSQERQLRNDFMKASGCTMPGDTRDRGGLFFASSRLVQQSGSGPLYFLDKASDSGKDALRFPSLGALTYLVDQLPEPTSRPATPDAAGQWSPGEMASLTKLCSEARKPAGVLSEDDLVDEGTPGKAVRLLEQQYEKRYFNWPLLHAEAMLYMPLKWQDDPAGWQQQVYKQLHGMTLRAPILLLNVDGGGSNDRFLTPGALTTQVSGAALHALQAMSLQQPLREATWHGALVDLLLGIGCVLIGTGVHVLVLHRLQQYLPGMTRLCAAGFSLLLAAGFSYLGVIAATWLMISFHLWFNPLYVVLGMAMHAFIEGWSTAEAEEKAEPAQPITERALFADVFLRAAAPQKPAWDARLRLASYWLLMLGGAIALLINTFH